MPAPLVEAFQFNAFNLTTITGFYGVMFAYFSLIATISAAMWGSDIISKEERDKTVEFLLTLPVTRSKVVTAKTLAALVNCIGLLLITWGASIVFSAKYNPGGDFYSFLTLEMEAIVETLRQVAGELGLTEQFRITVGEAEVPFICDLDYEPFTTAFPNTAHTALKQSLRESLEVFLQQVRRGWLTEQDVMRPG